VLVTLIGQNQVNRLILPQAVIGNYWIANKKTGRPLVNIESKNGRWEITSNKDVRVISGSWRQTGEYEVKATKPDQEIIEKITLQEYSMHYICIGKGNDLFILYCSPVHEDKFMHLNIINPKEILIGKSPESHISYKLALVEKLHASLLNANGKWILKNYDKRYGTFVNNEPVSFEKELVNGDVVFVMGLKIIIMGNSLFVNNPFDRMHYDSHTFALKQKEEIDISKLKQEDESDIEIYEEEEYFSRAPRLTNEIEHVQIKIAPPPAKQDTEQMPLIYMLLPMLTMGMMSMVMAFMAISNVMNGNSTWGMAAPQLIMSIRNAYRNDAYTNFH